MPFWENEIEAELRRMKEQLTRSGGINFSDEADLNSVGLDTVLGRINNLVGMQKLNG